METIQAATDIVITDQNMIPQQTERALGKKPGMIRATTRTNADKTGVSRRYSLSRFFMLENLPIFADVAIFNQ